MQGVGIAILLCGTNCETRKGPAIWSPAIPAMYEETPVASQISGDVYPWGGFCPCSVLDALLLPSVWDKRFRGEEDGPVELASTWEPKGFGSRAVSSAQFCWDEVTSWDLSVLIKVSSRLATVGFSSSKYLLDGVSPEKKDWYN